MPQSAPTLGCTCSMLRMMSGQVWLDNAVLSTEYGSQFTEGLICAGKGTLAGRQKWSVEVVSTAPDGPHQKLLTEC